jgi:hypothetical protein
MLPCLLVAAVTGHQIVDLPSRTFVQDLVGAKAELAREDVQLLRVTSG